MFLQEIHNNLYSRGWASKPYGGEIDKFDSLIKDWLNELRKQADLESYADMKAAFIEEVGIEQWMEPDYWNNEEQLQKQRTS